MVFLERDEYHQVPLFGGVGRAWCDLGTPMTEVGDRWVPQVIYAELPGDDSNPDLGLKIEVRQGVPVYTRLTLLAPANGPHVRDKDLKNVDLDDWLEHIVAAFSFTGDGQTLLKDTDRRAAALSNVRRSRAGRPRLPQTHLAKAAQVYRDNIDGKPTDAVRRAFGVSERTAARYVENARQAGLLPPTTPGKKNA